MQVSCVLDIWGEQAKTSFLYALSSLRAILRTVKYDNDKQTVEKELFIRKRFDSANTMLQSELFLQSYNISL